MQRGPVVYCLESVDNGDDLNSLVLPHKAALEAVFEPELLSGVIVLRGSAVRVSAEDFGAALYRQEPPAASPVAVMAIPYFAWDNRAMGEMLVWVRVGAGVQSSLRLKDPVRTQ